MTQPNDRGFGRAIKTVVDLTNMPGNGCHIYHCPALLLLHYRQDMLEQQEDSSQVGVYNALKFAPRCLDQRLYENNTCNIDEYIDLPVGCHDLLNHTFYRNLVRYITTSEVIAIRACRMDCGWRVQNIDRDHVVTVLLKPPGSRLTDSASGPGNDGNLSA